MSTTVKKNIRESIFAYFTNKTCVACYVYQLVVGVCIISWVGNGIDKKINPKFNHKKVFAQKIEKNHSWILRWETTLNRISKAVSVYAWSWNWFLPMWLAPCLIRHVANYAWHSAIAINVHLLSTCWFIYAVYEVKSLWKSRQCFGDIFVLHNFSIACE